MYGAKLSVTAALACTALAQSASFSKSPECQEKLQLFSDVPLPSPALASYLADAAAAEATSSNNSGNGGGGLDATFEDPNGYQAYVCSVAATLPKSLVPEFVDFGSSLLSYGSAHLSQYDAYVTDCIASGEAASTITSQLHEMLTGTGGMCGGEQATATATPSPTTTPAYPTGTGAYTPGPTATSSTVPIAAAARPTGAVVGAAALGGLLGVVALL